MVILICLVLAVFIFKYLFPQHNYVINVYFGVPGSGKTTFAAYLTKWCNHEALPIKFARYFISSHYITRCTHVLIYLQWQWISFLCEKQIRDSIDLGFRLSGVAWILAMLPVRFSRWLLDGTKLFKRHIDVYSNVPITGTYVVNAKDDLGKVDMKDGKLIIDEAGVEFNNRDYKSFGKDAIYFFKYHRHAQLSVDVFSQSFEDMDVTIRRLARNFYIVKKSLIPNFILVKRVIRRVGIDKMTHQISDQYDFGIPIIDTKWVYCPPLWKLFNTYSYKDLPDKEWTLW